MVPPVTSLDEKINVYKLIVNPDNTVQIFLEDKTNPLVTLDAQFGAMFIAAIQTLNGGLQ